MAKQKTKTEGKIAEKETGRLTLPVETGIDEEIKRLFLELSVDAVRNSDGTELPEVVKQLASKVYATYFPARGDQEWANANPGERIRLFLMSQPVTALSTEPLEIEVLEGYYRYQFAVDLEVDTDHYWQVIDRTTGVPLPSYEYQITALSSSIDEPEAQGASVKILNPIPYHRYTVNFLAKQLWDGTQMYNYLTNGWKDDSTREREKPYDVAHPKTWEYMQQALRTWLVEHPEVDVVRFTTFFYHFTLIFNDSAKEKFVDWFGYSASVSVPALEAFAEEYGYSLTPEDFVDQGYYNSPFRNPTKAFRDWIDFQSRFVAKRAADLVRFTHDAGKEAMMFLGDNWIGMEPYGPYFEEIGLDAVVGSVGSAATCRMIADIPGVKYTEGRFLPYFFPDVFKPGGDPVKEANESWLGARRAIVRNPLDRIGYGGYLSLALQFPQFMTRMKEIIDEFRQIHAESGGERPANYPLKVGILNAWGRLRTWQTHMVAHALWYRQAYTYLGVIEALAGLPFQVEFLSFDEVIKGVPEEIDVIINAGSAQTAFSGGEIWRDLQLQQAIRQFVAEGGGLIGIGDPTYAPGDGQSFALADVLGVDRELGWSLSYDRYPQVSAHFITEDLGDLCEHGLNLGEDPGFNFALGEDTAILALDRNSVQISAHSFGRGRSVYLSGCAYSAQNTRLLTRSLLWAGQKESEIATVGWAQVPEVEVAWYPQTRKTLIYNSSFENVQTQVTTPIWSGQVVLPALGYKWIGG